MCELVTGRIDFATLYLADQYGSTDPCGSHLFDESGPLNARVYARRDHTSVRSSANRGKLTRPPSSASWPVFRTRWCANSSRSPFLAKAIKELLGWYKVLARLTLAFYSPVCDQQDSALPPIHFTYSTPLTSHRITPHHATLHDRHYFQPFGLYSFRRCSPRQVRPTASIICGSSS